MVCMISMPDSMHADTSLFSRARISCYCNCIPTAHDTCARACMRMWFVLIDLLFYSIRVPAASTCCFSNCKGYDSFGRSLDINHLQGQVLPTSVNETITRSVHSRPFLYRGELHLSYSIDIFDKSLPLKPDSLGEPHKMRFQGTGFARLDAHSRELHSLATFSKPLVPRRNLLCCDKNWGVLEHRGQLYIFYTLLPCLTIFQWDPDSETGVTFVYASCLKESTKEQTSKVTGLDMLDVRISGHPILWSQYPHTLLVLVHHNRQKHGGSKHWAVRLQFDPARRIFIVVAVSTEPVLDHADFHLHNEALQNGLAIGSYHMSSGLLRILYGDGDKYSAYADVHTSSIKWAYLSSTSAVEWISGPTVALGDRTESITYSKFKGLVW